LDEAIAEYKEAIRINPNDARVHNNLGGICAKQGKWEEAIAEFEKAIRINPNHANAHKNLEMAKKESKPSILDKIRRIIV
jgi:tetratricopeptide (TPR) repeat protein